MGVNWLENTKAKRRQKISLIGYEIEIPKDQYLSTKVASYDFLRVKYNELNKDYHSFCSHTFLQCVFFMKPVVSTSD